jgi:hypothetical protein
VDLRRGLDQPLSRLLPSLGRSRCVVGPGGEQRGQEAGPGEARRRRAWTVAAGGGGGGGGEGLAGGGVELEGLGVVAAGRETRRESGWSVCVGEGGEKMRRRKEGMGEEEEGRHGFLLLGSDAHRNTVI